MEMGGSTSYIAIWKRPCWKCGEVITVSFDLEGWSFVPEADSDEGGMWSDRISQNMTATLSEGVDKQFRKTSVVQEGYFANVCGKCNSVQGDWYLHEEIIEYCYEENPKDFSIQQLEDGKLMRSFRSIPELSNYNDSRTS
jgi:hypothetical protein